MDRERKRAGGKVNIGPSSWKMEGTGAEGARRNTVGKIRKGGKKPASPRRGGVVFQGERPEGVPEGIRCMF